MGGRGIAFGTVVCVGWFYGDVMDGCNLLRKRLPEMFVFEEWHFGQHGAAYGNLWIFVICPLLQGVGESRVLYHTYFIPAHRENDQDRVEGSTPRKA
jgi:hypothetical protein